MKLEQLRKFGTKKKYNKRLRSRKKMSVKATKEFRAKYGKVRTRLRARYIRAKNRWIRNKRKCKDETARLTTRIQNLANKAFAMKGPRKTRKDKGKKRSVQAKAFASYLENKKKP